MLLLFVGQFYEPCAALRLQVAPDMISRNAELHALAAVSDVQTMLRLLAEVDDVACLGQFDMFEVHRCGVTLLRVTNGQRRVNRSAYVEINDFKRRLCEVPCRTGGF